MNQNEIPNPICYAKAVDSNHLWGDIPTLGSPVSKLVLQMFFAMIINHGLSFVFQYFRQPPILSNILTALVLSPSTLNKINHNLGNFIFPQESFAILETISNLGLTYAMFIQGLHADLTPIAHRRVKTACLGSIAFILPFTAGIFLYLSFQKNVESEKSTYNVEVVSLYWGTIIAATSFPTLAPILANLKIFCTNVGQEALSMALFNDVLTSLLVQFILGTSLSSSTSSSKKVHLLSSSNAWLAFLCMLLYMIFCGIVIKPIISKVSDSISKGKSCMVDIIIQIIVFALLACGFIGDYFGSHFIFTAFVFGTSVPSGIISEILIQKMEGCVSIILMPLYFAKMGTKIDVNMLIKILDVSSFVLTGIITKALCISPFAFLSGFSIVDGLALGFLMSAKGLVPLVILNIGHDRGHLSEESYTSLLLILLLSTSLVGPITSICYAQNRKSNHCQYQRTLEGAKAHEELRIITCIHSPQNVYNIINLLEISNITSKLKMPTLVLHLIELIGQAPPMIVEHAPRNSFWDVDSKPFFRRARNQSFQIIEAFHEYEDKKGICGLVQLFTMVSPIDIMHEDISILAEDKHASLIILSFHMQEGIDSKLEDANVEFRIVNQRLMSMSIAPCTVALFVDRGLRVSSLTSSIHSRTESRNGAVTQIAMVYIGGPDDREALTYASRMASHPFVTLSVIRILIHDITMEINNHDTRGRQDTEERSDILAMRKQIEKEKKADDVFLKDFKENNAHNKSIYYIEKWANNGDEAISILREMHHDYNLYIVGKRLSKVSPLIGSLEVWSEYRELGPIGDIIVTSDFSNNSSVLVIQQYNKQSSHTTYGDNFSY